MKCVDSKNIFKPATQVVYATDKAVVPVFFCFCFYFCYSLLLCGSYYGALHAFKSCLAVCPLVSSYLLAL